VKDMSISQPFILALALNNYDPFFGIKNKADINKMNDNIYTQVIDYMRICACVIRRRALPRSSAR
jgi:hypothetical protein